MADDALDLIIEDHDRFRDLLNRYEEIPADDHGAKQATIEELIPLVVRHSAMEEQAFYPFVLEHVPNAEDDVREEIEEHHVLEIIMSELSRLEPTEKQFDAKVEVFAENLLHHLEEEEEELFPVLRDELGADTLVRLRADLEAAREHAPTEPDPDRVSG